MAAKRAFDELFLTSAVHIAAKVGIENLRTKDVAEQAGFSEATMFRHFESKEALLGTAFLSIDKKVSDLLLQSPLMSKSGAESFDDFIYSVWHTVYRYLINNSEEALFLLRFRYSSLYTDEIRAKRQAYNGAFDKAYAVFEKRFGPSSGMYRGFLINYIFEMTLCFSEKIFTGKLTDDADTEIRIWLVISAAVKALSSLSGAESEETAGISGSGTAAEAVK